MLLSMLRRLIGRKTPPNQRQSADEDKRPAATCANLAMSFMRTTGAPASAGDALLLIESGIVPILRACVEQGDIQSALTLEEWAYVNCIVRFEHQAHYESSFRALEEPLHRLGSGRRTSMQQSVKPYDLQGPIAFFVQNLATDMAHVQLLADLIESFLDGAPEEARNLHFIGGSPDRISNRISTLSSKYGVALHRIDNTTGPAAVYEALDRWARQMNAGQIIFVSLPVGLSYCSARTGSVIGWLPMKFELPNFPAVVRRYAFASATRQRKLIDGRLWRYAPPLFARPPALNRSIAVPDSFVQAARRFGTILYSINRAEKISDARFLDVVCDLLAQFPDTCFVWTGRNPMSSIVAHFERRGLADRHFFAGWIVPDSLLSHGHIFLDTPHLSGTVAAQAMCHGIPVVSWTAAKSWLNFFLPQALDVTQPDPHPQVSSALEALHEQGVQLECGSPQAYFETAAKLIQDAQLRASFGNALKAIATTYFLDRQRAANAHFMNMREPD